MRASDISLTLLCGAAGFAATWQAGRIGYFPYDQSIVFDGAWRVVNGQVPWRDFVLPNGITPIVMQALAFELFGVSWASYVLHAAAVNAVAAGLVYVFMRELGHGRSVSFAVGLLTAATLYPPVGTPYLESHSLACSLLAIVCTYYAAVGPPRVWMSLAVPAALAAAALSKQIPAVFFLPLAFVLPALYSPQRGKAVAYMVAGFAATAAASCLIAIAVGVSGVSFWQHYVSIPLGAGGRRTAGFGVMFLSAIGDTSRSLPLTTTVLLAAVALFAVRSAAPRAVPSTTPPGTHTGGMLLFLSLWIALSTWAFAALTNNATELGLGLLPAAAGLAVAAALVVSAVSRTMPVLVAALLSVEAVSFHRAVNLPRTTHEMSLSNSGFSTWSADASVPPVLKATGFTRWQVPQHYSSAARSFPELVEYVRRHSENILITGDETIVYGLAGKPSVTPFLWFHPGLVWANDAASWRNMEDALIRNLDRYEVSKVVLPANVGWAFWQLSSFPRVAARVPLTGCAVVGSYRICDLTP